LSVEVENTRDAQHGDFASNLAMRLAKAARQNPRKLAEALVRSLPASPAVAKVEIAGAGFINFFLSQNAYHAEIARCFKTGAGMAGRSPAPADRCSGIRISEPDGPLHVGHGRHAAFGATVANLLEAVATAWSASTTSTMRAARWKFWRSAPGCDISSTAASVSRFPRTATAATTLWRLPSNCSPWKARSCARRRRGLREIAAG